MQKETQVNTVVHTKGVYWIVKTPINKHGDDLGIVKAPDVELASPFGEKLLITNLASEGTMAMVHLMVCPHCSLRLVLLCAHRAGAGECEVWCVFPVHMEALIFPTHNHFAKSA